MPKDSYICRYCGYVLPKKEAKISGWNSEHSLRHVHCPKYGKASEIEQLKALMQG